MWKKKAHVADGCLHNKKPHSPICDIFKRGIWGRCSVGNVPIFLFCSVFVRQNHFQLLSECIAFLWAVFSVCTKVNCNIEMIHCSHWWCPSKCPEIYQFKGIVWHFGKYACLHKGWKHLAWLCPTVSYPPTSTSKAHSFTLYICLVLTKPKFAVLWWVGLLLA